MGKQIHLNISEDLKGKLKEFSSIKNQTVTASITNAIETMFATEGTDPSKVTRLEKLLEDFFYVPKSFNTIAFYTMLGMLAHTYPDESSKNFWGVMVYLGDEDLSHKEVYTEIKKTSNKLKE